MILKDSAGPGVVRVTVPMRRGDTASYFGEGGELWGEGQGLPLIILNPNLLRSSNFTARGVLWTPVNGGGCGAETVPENTGEGRGRRQTEA